MHPAVQFANAARIASRVTVEPSGNDLEKKKKQKARDTADEFKKDYGNVRVF